MTTRILIADDHGLLRAGLHAILNSEPDFKVVGEAADGGEAVRLARTLQPDVVLMDISMPGMGGIEATRSLLKFIPDLRVLILTVHEDGGLLQEAIQAGASGYILKRAVKAELIIAIKAVMRGDLYVYPSMTRALLTESAGPAEAPRGKMDVLTPRELAVLRLIALGYTNNEIAEQLNISVRTVEYHRGNIMGKLALQSRAELVRYAAKNGLLDDSPGAAN